MTHDPIFMSREEHLEHIQSLWRHKRADKLRAEVLYNEQLIAVSAAMAEREPIDKAAAAIWSSYFAYLTFGMLLIWEMCRP